MTLTDRLLALAGVIPPFVLLYFAERFERRIREPAVEWRYRIFVAAGLASIPIAWLERGAALLIEGAAEPLYTLFESFIIAASIEEGGKAACLLLLTRGALSPRTRYGAFLYALHASMGFALVENVIAMLKTPDLVAFSTRWILRAYMTVPMHLVAGGVLGYLWARRRFDRGRIGLMGGFGVAVLIHGSYDAMLLAVERLPDGAETAQLICVVGAMSIPLGGVLLLRLCAGHLRRLDSLDEFGEGDRGRRTKSPGSVAAPD